MEATNIDLFSGYIKLNVGGYLYQPHKDALAKCKDSLFAELVKKEMPLPKGATVLVDRDGRLFGIILSYLRDKASLKLDSFNSEQLEDLRREAQYYNLVELVELCSMRLELPARLQFPLSGDFNLHAEDKDILMGRLLEDKKTAVVMHCAVLFNIGAERVLDVIRSLQPVPFHFYVKQIVDQNSIELVHDGMTIRYWHNPLNEKYQFTENIYENLLDVASEVRRRYLRR